MFRSYDAIVGVASHDWIHQLGEEAVSSGISQGTKEEILRYQPGYQGGYTQVSARIPRRIYSGITISQDTKEEIFRYQPGYPGGDTQVSARIPRRRYSGISRDTQEEILSSAQDTKEISQDTKEEKRRHQPGYSCIRQDTQVSARIPRRRYSGKLRHQPGYSGISQDTKEEILR